MRLRSVSLHGLLAGLLLLAGALVSAGPAPAQEPSPSHMAIARDLVVAAGASGGIDRIVPGLVDDIRKQILTRPELSKDMEEVLKAMQPELELQRQQAYQIAARSYAKWLTEAEIRDAVAFFRSPAGMKYVKIQPELTDDLIGSITAWSSLAGEYVQTRVRAEMAKRGHQMQ